MSDLDPSCRVGLPEPLSGNGDVVIFQNFYADGQQQLLDPAFVPHDGRFNANTHYREIGLFMRLYHSGRYRSGRLTGILSPKFGEKTLISGREFVRFITGSPGYDVYFINPYPCNAYYTLNVWEHGEICHEGLMGLAQDLFDRAGIAVDLVSFGRNSHATLLYCNYWVGNERFWNRFLKFVLKLVEIIEHLPSGTRERLFALDPYYPDPVPILPFFFERLFSTFLVLEPSICGLAYPHTRDSIIRSAGGNLDDPIIIRSFIDVIDEIDRRAEYTERDREIFRAIARLKRQLTQGRVYLGLR